MLSIELTVFAAIAYLTILFSIAYRGDRAASNRVKLAAFIIVGLFASYSVFDGLPVGRP